MLVIFIGQVTRFVCAHPACPVPCLLHLKCCARISVKYLAKALVPAFCFCDVESMQAATGKEPLVLAFVAKSLLGWVYEQVLLPLQCAAFAW